ncbi:MAG: sensor histidine kinase [Gemmatimonadota bacterium]
MSDNADLVGIWLGAALAVLVILFALGAALVINQRRFLALHREHAKRLIAAHEEERAYVAREVHDDALQRVAMLQHELRDLTDGPRVTVSGEHARVNALSEELADLGVMLRQVAHRLHPAIIEQGGLIPALAQLADDVTRASGIDVMTTLPPPGSDRGLGRERSITLFRIAQEALRNVVRHSGAKTAGLALEKEGQSLTMTIRDSGSGFEAGAQQSGLGLVSMSERARLVDSVYSVVSVPGRGTTIRVRVQLDEEP